MPDAPSLSAQAVPCGRTYCRFCPARRDRPDFSYPEAHVLDMVVLEGARHRARFYVDGAVVEEVPLRPRSLRRARKVAAQLYSDLHSHAYADASRAHLDAQAHERFTLLNRVMGEMDELAATP